MAGEARGHGGEVVAAAGRRREPWRWRKGGLFINVYCMVNVVFTQSVS